jgi:prepilin-type N-terminal cleavage/methylation domain-containing protein
VSKKLLHNKKIKNGFTLVELMVVVAIIGILALIGLRVYADQQNKAKNSIVKGNASTVNTLLQSTLNDHDINEIDENFLNDIVNDCGIHNPFNPTQQTESYYSDSSKPSMGDGQEGNVYIWKDASDVFHINGWNSSGDDVLLTDLTARK